MLERLNQAMDHIEDHLGEPIDVAEPARIAMTSEYHFRRMFSALAGIPLSEYVRRRRLTLAGAEVLAGERTLLDVAVRYGYGSGEAFARAFRAMHGVGPGEARRTGAALHSQPRMSFRLIVEGKSGMRYRVVEKDGFRLVGRGTRVPLVHEGMNPAIVEFVRSIGRETLDSWEAYANGEPEGVLAAVSDHSADDAEGTEIGYFHGVVSDAEVPGASDSLDAEPGTWAVFESSGEFPSAVQYLWRDVYTQWFPSNPYRGRPGPSLSRTRVSEDGTHAEAEVWIPVERVRE
ncbi:AraC family transcriptional regulator [Streptomyces brevispora]|uniref:AraC family transcriptional regulator n=1 Tax=Streptomyces brevispora TaxID=887462 RepID=A0A561UY35_9ACTN|nr:AraC family transcriptional regulator [Streptomyces brevispora]TWG04273.1 AraC family transcriptional regulator [Streptomyces brevispora]WSC14674.1 AraC family transcriptional regulator [Streptomyces brevispora]